MNPYTCTECDWVYDVLTMGGRVKAVTRHQLAHLVAKYRLRSDDDEFADFTRRTADTQRSPTTATSEGVPLFASGRRGSDDRLHA